MIGKPLKLKLTFFLCLTLFASSVQAGEVNIRMDLGSVTHKMQGGIGASWHAISAELPKYEKDSYPWPLRREAPRGSAWGGNAPVENKASWRQVREHARWLGLDWLRVELSQRMYEPKRREYDWDNEEMQALYLILDWCQENGSDVFLTQMWSNVEWNAFEDIHPLHSAPKSVDDFAEGLAELMEHLVKKREYACIRWLCINNEPGYNWAWWIGPNGKDHSITPALKAVREALDKRSIKVPLSGPDWTNPPRPDSPEIPQKIDFDRFIGAYDIHSYTGADEQRQGIWASWTKWARQRGKPLFLSEMGDMKLGWRGSNSGPKTFAAALSNAESVLRGLAVGIDAFNRWSFVNRGDLDGQWQLVRTWDIDKQEHHKNAEPESVAYFGFGILTRFTAKHSDVLECKTESESKVLAGALRSPKGNLTLIVANLSNEANNMTVEVCNVERIVRLFRYSVTEAELTKNDFRLVPEKRFRLSTATSKFEDAIKPQSITVYTTYCLEHDAPGITAD